ncbi:MAG: 2,3-diphosphoglycerate synthetase [Actinobacteria bacterium]|nr:MAG: 2,3-diphosphoglycerate synthetase [Actinomycetota bacterium]
MKVIALVDGEHYPSVTQWGLTSARHEGYEIVAALLVGGLEKLGADRRLDIGDTPVIEGAQDPRRVLADAISTLRPDGVLDLSDEPVLGYEARMELASMALARGVSYLGPDFRLDPPVTEPALPAPTLAVIGTGKRVAKTAIAAHVARVAVAAGHRPVIVAMGRGGPPEPVVAGPGEVTLEALLARMERGEHAASDFLEDALTAGVPTVGARRCGGGLAGRPFVTNVAQAAGLAVSMGGDPVILEGSGASVPTVPWDAGVLVAPASLPPGHLGGYLGPYRVLLSDLLILIMDGSPITGRDRPTLYSLARRLHDRLRVAFAELQPVPLADVRGKDAFFATTAHQELAARLADQLERSAGCRVVSFTSQLADRPELERALASAPPYDVLLTELKAAAVDVAAPRALARGAEVVFVDNRPTGVGGDGDLDELIGETIDLARERGAWRVRRNEVD